MYNYLLHASIFFILYKYDLFFPSIFMFFNNSFGYYWNRFIISFFNKFHERK